MKPVRCWISVLAVLSLCGCWNGKEQYREFMELGHARHAPLIIYDISANDPHNNLHVEPLAIGLLNTQDQEITSVTLTIATCGVKGAAWYPHPLPLGGPFEPNASYVISPVSAPDEDGKQERIMHSHMMITAVEVVDASGTRKIEGKAVGTLLSDRIANYCATGGM